MARKIFDSSSAFSQSQTALEHTRTEFFQVDNFGFAKFVVLEQYDATWYPTPDVVVDAGWFDLDIHNANTGDFNGDGLIDVVVAPALFTHVVGHPETILEPIVFFQDGGGGFVDPYVVSSNSAFPSMHMPYRTGVGDFNGDGFDDFAIAASQLIERLDDTTSSENIELPAVGFGNASGSVRVSQDFGGLTASDYGYGHALAVGDFNGDGRDDFASSRTVLYSEGLTRFNPSSIRSASEKEPASLVLSMGAGDFNEDGFDDLVFSPSYSESPANNGAELFLLFGSSSGLSINSSGTIFNPNRYSDYSDNRLINFINTIDFNGDGYEDLLFVEHKAITDDGDSSSYYRGGQIRLYEGRGNGDFLERTEAVRDPFSQQRSGEGNIHVTDVNGDGWQDFVLTGFEATGPYWGGGGPLRGETSIFINTKSGFDLLDESAFAYLDSYQISGFEHLKEWQTRVIPKMIPVDIGDDGLLDFIGFVDTPLSEWPQTEPIYTYAYVSRALSPLGRSDSQWGESLAGTVNDDRIFGYGGDDIFIATNGDDYLDGGDGIDTVRYPYPRAPVQQTPNGYSVFSDDLVNVERVEFTDTAVALDLTGATSAGGIYRLYKATFNREPDTGGLGYWIAQADAGSKDAVQMAEDFTWSEEFQDLYNITTTDNYGTGTDVSELVTGFYENVLGRTPDQGGLDFYTGVIESKERTVGRVLAEISDSPENYDGTIELIANGIIYEPWVG